MWLIFSLASMLFYAFCEIFQKNGADMREKHPALKMLVWFGIINIISALGIRLFGFTDTSVSAIGMLKERPEIILSPALYFFSLFLSFIALKLIPVSIAAPIQCSDGIFVFIGVIVLFILKGAAALGDETITLVKIVLCAFVIVGIYFCALIENKAEDKEKNMELASELWLFKNGKFAVFGIIAAVLSATLDAGSSLTDIYIISDIADSFDYIYVHNMLIALFTVVVYAILCFLEKKIYVPFKKSEIQRMLGAACDCIGLLFYMISVSYNSVYTAVLVPGYCVFSMILSNIFLKEKLIRKQKVCIFVVVISILAFTVFDELF